MKKNAAVHPDTLWDLISEVIIERTDNQDDFDLIQDILLKQVDWNEIADRINEVLKSNNIIDKSNS